MRILISLIMALVISSPVWAAQEWDKTTPCKTGVGSCGSADQRADFPADQQANNAALDRVLANYRQGMSLSYSSATTVSVSAGEVVCSTAAGDVRKMRQNTSATNVTFTDIDTGSEAPSTTYYLYANCDADATTATFKVSASSTAPTGITSFKRLGSFYNDASSNIQFATNDNENFKFGSSEVKSAGTTYRALTDGYFVGLITATNDGSWGDIIGYTDSSSTPTTVMGYASGWQVLSTFSGSVGTRINSFCIPIKRGNYYKGTLTGEGGGGNPTATFYFIPNGN